MCAHLRHPPRCSGGACTGAACRRTCSLNSLAVACRNRVTCYPEGVIWNALVDDWGATMHVADMYWAHERAGTSPAGAPSLPASPSMSDIQEFARQRQARRRLGLPPDGPPLAVNRDPESTRGLQVYDTAPAGETELRGVGKKVTERNAIASEVALSVGFHLYTHSRKNVDSRGQVAYEWPRAEHITGGSRPDMHANVQDVRGDVCDGTDMHVCTGTSTLSRCGAAERKAPVRGAYPAQLQGCPPEILSTLYMHETYSRARLCGWEPLSSAWYNGLKTKDDGWLQFQMYATRCEAASPPPSLSFDSPHCVYVSMRNARAGRRRRQSPASGTYAIL